MGSWWSDHPDLEGVARRGRREFEQEATEAEQDVELLRKRRRTLVDVCFEWMSRGDLVTLGVADHQFEGRLVAAVNDLVVVTTKTLEVAVNVALLRFARSDRAGAFVGTTGDRTASSFRAELGRYEVEAVAVRIVGDNGSFDLSGVVEASTDDHVLVRDAQGIEWALARGGIVFLIGEAAGLNRRA